MEEKLRHDLINKLCARAGWAIHCLAHLERARLAIPKGYYVKALGDLKEIHDHLQWVMKASEEAIDLLRGKEKGPLS